MNGHWMTMLAFAALTVVIGKASRDDRWSVVFLTRRPVAERALQAEPRLASVRHTRSVDSDRNEGREDSQDGDFGKVFVEGGDKEPMSNGQVTNESESSIVGAKRGGRFIGKFKDWYEGKKKEQDSVPDIIINSNLSTGGAESGPTPHPHPPYPYYHQPPLVQPIIIGTGAGFSRDPMIITKPVTQFVTVAQPVAVTVTKTIIHTADGAHTHATLHTSKPVLWNPSHVLIEEPQTMQPVTINLGAQNTAWGWGGLGGLLGGGYGQGDNHVVYMMQPNPPLAPAPASTQIVIQQEVPIIGSLGAPTTSEVMVMESPGHVLDQGIKRIKDTFSAFNSGIYKVGQGIKDNINSKVQGISSFFSGEDHGQVVMIQQPHLVTVPTPRPPHTQTVVVQQPLHGRSKGKDNNQGRAISKPDKTVQSMKTTICLKCD